MSDPDRQVAPPNGWLLGPGAHTISQRDSKRTVSTRLGIWLLRRVLKVDATNLLDLIMRHPRLAWPWLRFSSRLAPNGTLKRTDTELVILRVAWNCRCRYEWGQHIHIAGKVGITTAELARVPHGSQAKGWNTRQAALLDAADDIHRTRVIADATWHRLERHYDTRELIELCMLIGQYEGISGLLNSFGLSLEESTEQGLARVFRSTDPKT